MAPLTPGRAAALLVREAGVTPMVPRLPGDSAADTGLGFGRCRSVLGFLCGTDFPLRFAEPSGPWWDLSFMSGQDPSQAFTQSRQAWLGAGSRHLSLPTHSESSHTYLLQSWSLPTQIQGTLRKGWVLEEERRDMLQSGLGVGKGL